MIRALRYLLFLSLAVAFFIAFGMRFGNEDLLVGFCSGRDTLNGLLAKPDHWSFTTFGRVWVDQSCFSHLVFYLSYLNLGELGPVLIKAILLAASLGILYVRCRSLGVSKEISLVAVTLGALSIAPFSGIRAENFGLLYFLVFTSFLTAPAKWGKWRQAGCVLVLAVWCNSHGSFMLGLALLGLRFAVDLLYQLKILGHPGPAPSRTGVAPQREAKTGSVGGGRSEERFVGSSGVLRVDALGWLVTGLISLAVVVTVTPYGMDNLTMPFRQVSAGAITSRSKDWAPLMHSLSLSKGALFKPLDVVPFLLFLTVTGIFGAVALAGKGTKESLSRLLSREANHDLLMELAIAMAVLPLAFKFRRLTLFAAPSLVPVAALLFQSLLRHVELGTSGWARTAQALRNRGLTTAAVLGWALLLFLVLGATTIPPYLPGNPMRPDRPLVSQLMSFDSYTTDVTDFMNRNKLAGRVVTSWGADVFLLFRCPNVQLFMDCRDQSAYLDDVIRTYFSLFQPENLGHSLDVLDKFRVEYILLATNPQDFGISTLLMGTKRWSCIYKDEDFFLLARSEGSRFEKAFASGRFDEWWFPNPETRIVTESVLSLFRKGSVSEAHLAGLQDIVRIQPEANLYSLITFALNGESPCLKPATRAFLVEEWERLSQRQYLVAAGATRIVQSLERVLEILEANEARCGSKEKYIAYKLDRDKWSKVFEDLTQKYRGY